MNNQKSCFKSAAILDLRKLNGRITHQKPGGNTTSFPPSSFYFAGYVGLAWIHFSAAQRVISGSEYFGLHKTYVAIWLVLNGLPLRRPSWTCVN